jgi:hypothetical protein
MDTNNEKTIEELIQELSDAVLDCLQKTNGDDVCYIDRIDNRQYYLNILLAICKKKQIQLDKSIIEDCFVKANAMAEEQYIPWMNSKYWDKSCFITEDNIKFAIVKNEGTIESIDKNSSTQFVSLDPVCTGLITGEIAELMASFNCEESANRVFNEVHFYPDGDPNLTIGFGHFASGNETNLFSYMDDDTKKTSLSKKEQELGNRAKERLIQYVAFRLSLNKKYLEQFIGDSIIKKKWPALSIDSIDSSTLYEMVSFFFSKAGALNSNYIGESHYKKDKKGKNGFATVSGLAYWADQAIYYKGKNLFPKGEKESSFWFNDIMGVKQTIEDKLYYPALCLKEVALWQIIYWVLVKELNTAKITAASKNLDTHYGAVAALTSWKSTGYGYGDEAVTKCIGSIDINTPEGKHKAALKFWEHYNEKRLDEKLENTKGKINKLEEKKKKEGLTEEENKNLAKLKKEEAEIEKIQKQGKSIPEKYIRARQKSIFSKWLQTQQQTFGNIVFALGVDSKLNY